MTTSHAHREENLLEDIQERLDNLNKSERPMSANLL